MDGGQRPPDFRAQPLQPLLPLDKGGMFFLLNGRKRAALPGPDVCTVRLRGNLEGNPFFFSNFCGKNSKSSCHAQPHLPASLLHILLNVLVHAKVDHDLRHECHLLTSIISLVKQNATYFFTNGIIISGLDILFAIDFTFLYCYNIHQRL